MTQRFKHTGELKKFAREKGLGSTTKFRDGEWYTWIDVDRDIHVGLPDGDIPSSVSSDLAILFKAVGLLVFVAVVGWLLYGVMI